MSEWKNVFDCHSLKRAKESRGVEGEVKLDKLNLGCGGNKMPLFVNVDIDSKRADVVHDLNKVPYPFEDESIKLINASQVLDHLSIHPIDFFKECRRILCAGGLLHFTFPNNFYWRNRLKFLCGRFEFQSGWHPFHSKLIKPSTIFEELNHLGFDADLRTTVLSDMHLGIDPPSTSKGLWFLPLNWRLFNVAIMARKRA